MNTLIALINVIAGFGWQITWGTLVWLLADLLAVATIPSVLLERRGRPLSAIAWLMALIGLPFIGVGAWWAIGRRHLHRLRRRLLRARSTLDRRQQGLFTQTSGSRAAPLLDVRLPEEELGHVFPVVDGNQLGVLVDAIQVYAAIEQAIRRAKHHLHIQFYIWEADSTGRRFRDLLADAARRGVQVRVLIDAVGGSDVRGRFMDPLRAAGGQVAFFLPTRWFTRRLTINFRNHRKLVIVDGQTGFIGGLNIGDEYTHDWHDIAVQLEGPVVAQQQEVFADDWFFATAEDLADPGYFSPRPPHDFVHQAQPNRRHRARCSINASGPDTRQNASHDALFIAISGARERLYITTPYFIPSPALQTALRTSAYRGVDVQLLLPARSDVPLVQLAARSYYPDLLSAGIRIHEYERAILHSKVMVVDRELAVVGSANLDIRSLQLNFEANCYIFSPTVNRELADLFAVDVTASREVYLHDLKNRRGYQELLEAVANLLSPLL